MDPPDPRTGKIRWTPLLNQEGEHTFWVRAIDRRGGQAVQSFTVNVIPQDHLNQTPAISGISSQEAYVGKTFVTCIQANDPEGDPLTYELLPGHPEGMGINEETGRIAWIPKSNQTGIRDVFVRVYDTQGGISTRRFEIEVSGSFPEVMTGVIPAAFEEILTTTRSLQPTPMGYGR